MSIDRFLSLLINTKSVEYFYFWNFFFIFELMCLISSLLNTIGQIYLSYYYGKSCGYFGFAFHDLYLRWYIDLWPLTDGVHLILRSIYLNDKHRSYMLGGCDRLTLRLCLCPCPDQNPRRHLLDSDDKLNKPIESHTSSVVLNKNAKKWSHRLDCQWQHSIPLCQDFLNYSCMEGGWSCWEKKETVILAIIIQNMFSLEI